MKAATIRKYQSKMDFKHFEIHVRDGGHQFIGSWRVCSSDDLDHATHGESDIPLGPRLTLQKLEDFALNAIAQANNILLHSPRK